MSKENSRIWMRKQWNYFELLCFSKGIMNLDHRFWLLMIIKNMGNNKTTIVVKKLCENNPQRN
jgi:hypothetical protein